MLPIVSFPIRFPRSAFSSCSVRQSIFSAIFVCCCEPNAISSFPNRKLLSNLTNAFSLLICLFSISFLLSNSHLSFCLASSFIAQSTSSIRLLTFYNRAPMLRSVLCCFWLFDPFRVLCCSLLIWFGFWVCPFITFCLRHVWLCLLSISITRVHNWFWFCPTIRSSFAITRSILYATHPPLLLLPKSFALLFCNSREIHGCSQSPNSELSSFWGSSGFKHLMDAFLLCELVSWKCKPNLSEFAHTISAFNPQSLSFLWFAVPIPQTLWTRFPFWLVWWWRRVSRGGDLGWEFCWTWIWLGCWFRWIWWRSRYRDSWKSRRDRSASPLSWVSFAPQQ